MVFFAPHIRLYKRRPIAATLLHESYFLCSTSNVFIPSSLVDAILEQAQYHHPLFSSRINTLRLTAVSEDESSAIQYRDALQTV